MKKTLIPGLLLLLVACQSTPRLEDDTRYVKLAKVVDVHVFTDAERKEAAKTAPRSNDSGVSFGIGIGVGTGGYSGMMIGANTGLSGVHDKRKEPPQVATGANRFTVQPLNSSERIEVMSYKHYKVGDCVKVLSGHPTEFARLFDPKEGERCN
ncbi:hypothetical protein [Sideroxydans lithotrophicus]|uniref:Uncharacterized protein n=1 Tax=Sideroxydans lithotrophicus (strain ES-1) TaxID=580332 RepID=D5CQF8_SIDLE|nr:hypothetical protein [Sideroxydans lithotrophicus]ADE13179.1 hypothetical protein Slit_2954 [Sideroxydans lithotrophicus ES-1]